MIRVARRALPIALAGALVACEQPVSAEMTGAQLVAQISDNWSAWSVPVAVEAANSGGQEQGPTLSKDGLSLYFQAQDRDGSIGLFDIWVTRRACVECAWAVPVPLGAAINSASFNESRPYLSRDGHWLFLNSNRTGSLGSGDIWAAYRENVHDDFAWGAPINQGPGVNTSGPESQAGYFENEGGAAQLYFTRAGKIFASYMQLDGSWSTAVLIEVLDHAAGANAPSLHPNGREMYFYSNRSGENRIWHTTRASPDSPWSAPTMLSELTPGEASVFHPFIHSHGGTETLLMVGFTAATRGDIYVSTRSR